MSFENIGGTWGNVASTTLRRRDDSGPRPAGDPDGAVPAAGAPGARYGEGELLGQGGMGQVRLVDDPVLGRRVAMKVMHAEVAATDDGRRRFLREARVQGQLEHPAIVPIYDLGQDAAGVPYFTMKRVRGVTLEAVLGGLAAGDAEVKARFPHRRLLSAFVQVCLAVDFAHSRAVLHRDLKPGNLMLGDFGDVHVLDWGLAQLGQERGPARDLVQALEDAARGGSVFGTPGYMSPEQVHGHALDARTDVYALGAILFELLTLAPMNPGLPGERLLKTVRGDGRSPSLAAPRAQVPPELDAVVLAATEPDPARRLTSARALAEAVERCLDGDRDLELRRAMAARHVAAAQPLVEGLDGATLAERETAMNHLTSALALAPGHGEALALLRRLLTHVPQTLPADVERLRARAEGEARAGLARTVAWRAGMWLALAPLVWAMGPVEPLLAGAVVLVVGATVALACRTARHTALSAARMAPLLVATGLVLLALTLLFGSFVMVPTLTSTALVMFASHLKARQRALAIAAAIALVLVPFLLEQLGLAPAAYAFGEDQLVVLPRLVHFPPALTQVVLVVATVSSLALPGVLAGRLRDRLSHAEDRLFMLAWHLEALGRKTA